jgi:hypothetical protein
MALTIVMLIGKCRSLAFTLVTDIESIVEKWSQLYQFMNYLSKWLE